MRLLHIYAKMYFHYNLIVACRYVHASVKINGDCIVLYPAMRSPPLGCPERRRVAGGRCHQAASRRPTDTTRHPITTPRRNKPAALQLDYRQPFIPSPRLPSRAAGEPLTRGCKTRPTIAAPSRANSDIIKYNAFAPLNDVSGRDLYDFKRRPPPPRQGSFV